MSRVIDPSKPLSKADQEYVKQRPWLRDELGLSGGSVTVNDDDAVEEGYRGMTVKELNAEIERRNDDRDEDDQIEPDSGRKADLVAALEADDEE